MPGVTSEIGPAPNDWQNMPRWQRKQFHRENESRVRRGLKPLNKPDGKGETRVYKFWSYA